MWLGLVSTYHYTTFSGAVHYFIFSKNLESGEEITFPDSLVSIGTYGLAGCVSLQELTFPEKTELGDYIAEGCTSLQSLIIKDGIVEISYRAFRDCTSLTEIYIPISITDLHNFGYDGCFEGCSIKDIYYAGSRVQWEAINRRSYPASNDSSGVATATVHYGVENPPKKFTPDINSDGTIDALDAAIVLQYAAYTGANGYVELSVFLAM